MATDSLKGTPHPSCITCKGELYETLTSLLLEATLIGLHNTKPAGLFTDNHSPLSHVVTNLAVSNKCVCYPILYMCHVYLYVSYKSV